MERKFGLKHVPVLDAAFEWKQMCKERYLFVFWKQLSRCSACFSHARVIAHGPVIEVLCPDCERNQLISATTISREYAIRREELESLGLPARITGRGWTYCRKHVERYIRGKYGADRLQMLRGLRSVKEQRLARNKEQNKKKCRDALYNLLISYGFDAAEIDTYIHGTEYSSAKAEALAYLEGRRFSEGFPVRGVELMGPDVACDIVKSIRWAALTTALTDQYDASPAKMLFLRFSSIWSSENARALSDCLSAKDYVPGDSVLGRLPELIASTVDPNSEPFRSFFS